MRSALIVLAALLPAACAHPRTETRNDEVVEVEVERATASAAATTSTVEQVYRAPVRPDDAYARARAFAGRPAPGGDVVEIPVPEGGMNYADLLAFVAREAQVTIRYESQNAVIKSKKATFMGTPRVAREDLIGWLQDACLYDGLALLPYGPADRREYAAVDYANPIVGTSPQWVAAEDLPSLRDRPGVYVACILTIPEGVDASRARQALSQLSTKYAGLGRVNDFDKTVGVLVVNDFANVVANMQRLLDAMAIELYEQSQR